MIFMAADFKIKEWVFGHITSGGINVKKNAQDSFGVALLSWNNFGVLPPLSECPPYLKRIAVSM